MKNSKMISGIFAFIALFIFHSTAIAQNYQEGTYEVDGCDGDMHTLTIVLIDQASDYSTATWRITIDGSTRTFYLNYNTGDNYYTVIDDSERQAYLDFYMEGLGCASGAEGAFAGVAAPADPLVSQGVQSFKAVVFAERAQPKAAGKREKKTQKAREEEQREEGVPGPVVPRLYGMVSSDVEREWFTINKVDGTNLAIRGGYAKTSDDGVLTYGGNYILNSLSFDGGGSSSNSTINLYGNKILLETEDRERTVGASANILMFENDNGIALAAYGVERKYDGDKILVYGGMFQYSKVGDLSSGYLMAAGMYGFPLANEKFSLNIDGLFIQNLFTSFDGESVDLDSKSILDLGINLSIYMSETFGLTVGAKKVFLVKDYSNYVLTLGGGFRF